MIKRVEKNAVPTMLHTSLANQVIDVCNAFTGLVISPANAGSLEVAGGSAVLKISPSAASILPEYPTTAGTKWALTYDVDTTTLEWTQLADDC